MAKPDMASEVHWALRICWRIGMFVGMFCSGVKLLPDGPQVRQWEFFSVPTLYVALALACLAGYITSVKNELMEMLKSPDKASGIWHL